MLIPFFFLLKVGFFQGEWGASSLFGDTAVPLMFLQAGNDTASCKKGGSVDLVLRKRKTGESSMIGGGSLEHEFQHEFGEFPDMPHGWVNRGDLRLPGVQRDVFLAISLAAAFFDKHL